MLIWIYVLKNIEWLHKIRTRTGKRNALLYASIIAYKNHSKTFHNSIIYDHSPLLKDFYKVFQGAGVEVKLLGNVSLVVSVVSETTL